MILITGATGQLGTAVLQTLLQKTAPNQLAALVRDEAKAAGLAAQGVNIRIGDYSDTASLDRAMQGVSRLLLISGGGGPDALQQHYNVVDAARRAGISCIAYTSRAHRDPATMANTLMKRHYQTEDYIKASGLPYILFRNILYMDVLPLYAGKDFRTTGLHFPAGDGKVSYALRSDMGEAIANALLTSPCDNRVYRLTGSQPYSFADVAAALTVHTGQPVAYTPIDVETFTAQWQERGQPAPLIAMMLGFMTDIKNGQEEETSPDLEQLLGRQPIGLQEGIKTLFAAQAGG